MPDGQEKPRFFGVGFAGVECVAAMTIVSAPVFSDAETLSAGKHAAEKNVLL